MVSSLGMRSHTGGPRREPGFALTRPASGPSRWTSVLLPPDALGQLFRVVTGNGSPVNPCPPWAAAQPPSPAQPAP
eukprot:158704-Chlamydomonas_euryale.AAC.1